MFHIRVKFLNAIFLKYKFIELKKSYEVTDISLDIHDQHYRTKTYYHSSKNTAKLINQLFIIFSSFLLDKTLLFVWVWYSQ